MSTDFQSARVALGARLRELRVEAGVNGKDFAARIGWQRSKVSRLENGKQTATAGDVAAWASAAGVPEQAADLASRLRGLESQQRSWRRQLAAGHRPVQDRYVVEYQQTATMRGYEATVIPGLFQTPGYAGHLFERNAVLMRSPRDTAAAVAACTNPGCHPHHHLPHLLTGERARSRAARSSPPRRSGAGGCAARGQGQLPVDRPHGGVRTGGQASGAWR
ncbi:Scr1 family TA system antitoxin-like transcriptional regulator [Streptomyces sp. NPDC059999]|uniref:Scr1 family TA system antitoxin-like transcriptional regulator n=1 Tax=Streptomyces sp. NPDC059999 TaxID=3347030 RepID=UPI0036B1F8BF